MENKNAIVISMFFLFLLVDCSSSNVKMDNVVECRLFWVSDTYPEEVLQPSVALNSLFPNRFTTHKRSRQSQVHKAKSPALQH